jgi:hypothetical protein
MVSVLQKGRTSPAPLPCSGQIAPKIHADFVRWSFGADGLVPRLAQRRVILFFWPTRASSWNQISMGVAFGKVARTFASSAAKPPF